MTAPGEQAHRLLTLMSWDFNDLMKGVPELERRIRERATERLERA